MRSLRASDQSYLYVIAAERSGGEQRVKVGRSIKPLQRRAQLQVGHGDKLRLVGSYKVALADAPRLEAAAKASLAPLKIKGEVFRAPVELACAVVEHIASGRVIDTFLELAIRREVVDREWLRLEAHPQASGRWANAEIVAALETARAASSAALQKLVALDAERMKRVDPIVEMTLRPEAEPLRAPLNRRNRSVQHAP